MADTLVVDIETQNFFTDPAVGRDNFAALKISVIGVYSYLQDKFFAFEENEIEKAAELFSNAELVVGFSINRYDVPVLHNYFQKLPEGKKVDLWKKERLDILDEIEIAVGHRVKLDSLAHANLGTGKTGEGSHAIELYKNGEMEKLKSYCLNDVLITRDIYNLGKQNNFLLVPQRGKEDVKKVSFNWQRRLFPI
ncbi:MAG: ribonuclease H-like domain-containing protein [Patescibacteria group bacterium]|nr:ribonuclease H-like domain-containing protein [Patescibacteria group bacterium]